MELSIAKALIRGEGQIEGAYRTYVMDGHPLADVLFRMQPKGEASADSAYVVRPTSIEGGLVNLADVRTGSVVFRPALAHLVVGQDQHNYYTPIYTLMRIR